MKQIKQLIYINDMKQPTFGNATKHELATETHLLLSFPDKADYLADVKASLAMSYAEYRMKTLGVGTSDVYNEAKSLLAYMWRTTPKGELTIYKIKDNNECLSALSSSDGFLNSLKSDPPLFKALKSLFEGSIIVSQYNPKMNFQAYLELLYKEFKLDADKSLSEEPSLLCWDKDTIAFKKFDPSIVTKGETPSWDEFLSRVDYPEVFLAWVWSCFEPKNRSRQALWMHGNGFDGKSTVINALATIYGLNHTCAISKDSYKGNFFFSQIYGKRFATYGDCKNARLISESRIHSLLGGDNVAIEYKSENAFTGRVYARLIIGSNLSPEIDFTKTSEYTRVIYLEVAQNTVKKGDSGFEQRLIEEAPSLLYKAREAYEKLCTDNGEIELPEEMWEKMQTICASKESSILDSFYGDCIEFDPKSIIPKERMQEVLKSYLMQKGERDKFHFMYPDLKQKLKEDNVEEKRVYINEEKTKRKNSFVGVKFSKEVEELGL